MRSNPTHPASLPLACLTALLLPVLPCHAQATQPCEVAVAVLHLPADSDGLLHWRDADSATRPLQLSTRYFSEPVQLSGGAIRFYQEPVPAGPARPDGPEPLLTMRFTEGLKRGYIVLWAESDEQQQTRWKGKLVSADEWRASSLKVINACAEAIGIAAGDKRIKLLPGKSLDFPAAEWDEPFPVKVFRLEPEPKTIFSSTWRVSAGRREICFIGNINGAITLRSLLELEKANPPAAPGL